MGTRGFFGLFGGIPATTGKGPPPEGPAPDIPGFKWEGVDGATSTHRAGSIYPVVLQCVERTTAKVFGRSSCPAYVPADTFPEAEFNSFRLQCERSAELRRSYREPLDWELDYLLARAEDAYEAVRWHLKPDWCGREVFEEVLRIFIRPPHPVFRCFGKPPLLVSGYGGPLRGLTRSWLKGFG